jgi:hypothetical protein
VNDSFSRITCSPQIPEYVILGCGVEEELDDLDDEGSRRQDKELQRFIDKEDVKSTHE